MTRTALAALALATPLLLAGCGSDSDPDAGGTTTDAPGAAPGAGPTDAAADDVRVVALDDFAAVHALSLGVVPDVVLNAFEYESTTAILEGYDNVEVQPYGAELDPEAVLAAEPDVVIGVSLPTTSAVEGELSEFAEVTVFDYAATWDEQLTDVAAALGKEAEAEALVGRIEADVEQLATDVAATESAGDVVSVLANNQGLFSIPTTTGLGSLMDQVGLERPSSQLEGDSAESPFVEFSSEKLADHDGDQVFLLTGGAYDPQPLLDNPLWEQLGAVQADAVHEVSGELWLGSSAFSVDWVLDDLRAVLVDGAEAATLDDAADRFATFVAG